MKLKHLILATILALGTPVMADNYAYLTIDKTNGETHFALSEISKITFDADNMIINLSNGSQAQLPLTSLNKMFFSDAGITAINSSTKEPLQVKLSGGIIHVNAPVGSLVTLYNMNGQAVRTVTTASDDTQINLNGMTKGVYIVKVGKQAKKVMNK